MLGLAREISDGSSEGEENVLVGVRYVKATKEHPPIRLFYPSSESTTPTNKAIRWFDHDAGSLLFLKGWAHMALARSDTRVFRFLFVPFLHLLSWILPLFWLRIPNVHENLPPLQSDKPLPIVLFSHGLTGTGEENKVLCAEWAKRGYIVVAVQHTDGSSCCVTLPDGSPLYYQRGPPYSNYDPTFRPKQVQQRSKELLQAYQYVITKNDNDEDNDDIRGQLATSNSPVIAAGFSYGAATAALAVTQNKSLFAGAIFLDGWFHIDVRESAGIAFQMPPEAFEQNGGGLPSDIPTLFVNSEQFEKFDDLFAATKELADRYQPRQMDGGDENNAKTTITNNTVHVLPGTGHQNFCDVVFWFQNWFGRKLMMGAIGPADPVKAYQEVIRLSSDFLDKVVSGDM